MTSRQYEEVCRCFLADLLGVPPEQVQSMDILNPTRPGLPEYAHQIDLFWKTEDRVAKCLFIANAKWRTPPGAVELLDVLLLQQVKLKVAAHKAVLLTNSAFSSGAQAAAQDEGIALHLVRPRFDAGKLHPSDRVQIQRQLRRLARRAGGRSLYLHEVVEKGLAPGVPPAAAPCPAADAAPASEGRPTVAYGLVAGPSGGPLSVPPIPVPGGGAAPGAGGPGGYLTRQGGGPGYRTK